MKDRIYVEMIVVASILVIGGFFLPLSLYITPKSGLGYYLGITGASMMGLLFLYSARKYFKFMANLANMKTWLHAHIFLGIFGPICILYHSCYSLGATNSNVALWSMVVVSISGFVGRFLYNRVGWERPFKWWHFAHLPFVGMLVLAAIAHIIASFFY